MVINALAEAKTMSKWAMVQQTASLVLKSQTQSAADGSPVDVNVDASVNVGGFSV